MPAETIKITGARQHNLRNLTLEIPRERLVVITGLSGSGKSSLAFDTLYAEGQRRYVESLSAYARQFLDQMQKPDVDFIEGLSLAIAIEQRSSGSSPRSIILMSSIGVFNSVPGLSAYNASKAALEAFGEALRYEAVHDGIFVSLIEPGTYATDIFFDNAK